MQVKLGWVGRELRIKSIWISFAIFGVGCIGGGGQKIQVKPSSIPSQENSVENGALVDPAPERAILRVDVVSRDSHEFRPRLPDPDNVHAPELLSATLPDPTITRGQSETIFHSKFFLPATGESENFRQSSVKWQFFTWPEMLEGSSIHTAFYSHRVLRGGQWLGNYRPKRAWHDDVHQRWFIPFFDIFENSDFYPESEARLEDIQVITLELLSGSGQTFTYQIKFQIVAPLPEVTLVEEEQKGLPEAPVLGEQLFTVGWVAKREILKNPTDHPLYLWLRLRPSDLNQLFLRTYLQSSKYRGQDHAPPLGPEFQQWVSRADLRISQLRVVHTAGVVEEDWRKDLLRLESDEWQGVFIAPGETLILEWLAHPVPWARDCSLPDSQTERLSWMSRIADPVPSPGKLDSFYLGEAYLRLRREKEKQYNASQPGKWVQSSREVTRDWSFLGEDIFGKWSRELHISYPFLSQTDGISGPFSQKITTDFIEIGVGIGQSRPKASQFSCQGIFR